MDRSIPKPIALSALRQRLAAIEHREASAIPTGWTSLDEALAHGGLQRNALHEWLGLATPSASKRWSPPLSVLTYLASQAITHAAITSNVLHVCWIGSRLWPSVPSLRAHPEVLARSLFVDAGDAPARLWAADLAARSSCMLTIVDGSSFDMAASRRLQLAAETGGWLVHLARPPWERTQLSAATTRWGIAREVSPSDRLRFAVELLRSKGLRSMTALDRRFVLERSDRDRLVLVSADVSNRSDASSPATGSAPADPARARRATA